MNTKLYLNTDSFVAGITMKDLTEPELSNMALHACEDTNNIIGNRRKLAAFLNCRLDDFVCAYQSHSSNFRKITVEDRGRGAYTMENAIQNTDALYTFEQGLLLCCFTADCVPVVLYDEEKGLICTIHSGWQGTIQEIVPKVINHLIHAEGCNPMDMHIIIGPAISRDKFEVDRDVSDRFKALDYTGDLMYFNTVTGKHHIDNQMIVMRQCLLLGIPEGNILIDRTCTFSGPDCFSYRRDRSCGRHLTFIIKK